MSMLDTERLLDVIERIYAAAARERPLEDPLGRLAESLGDTGMGMYSHDPVLGETRVEVGVGVDRAWLETYNTQWAHRNPVMQRGIADVMSGRIVDTEDVMPWHEVQKTDYYREYLRPLGLRYSFCALVAGKAQRFGSLVSVRGEQAGPYRPEHLQFVERMRPHLARALHLLEFFDNAQLTITQLSATLDGLPFALLVVDDERRLLFCNRKADDVVARGRPLAVRNGRLVVPESSDFAAQWKALVSSPMSVGLRLRLDPSGHHELDASRIGLPGAVSGRCWLLRLFDDRLDDARAARVWEQRWDLTPAEIRVALALLRHEDAPGAASALGLSVETVRGHLRNLFAKTGVRSQARLAFELARIDA